MTTTTSPTVDEQFLAYSKLMRPFPIKRLADALYHVQADANSIGDALLKLQLDPPVTADEWVAELERLDMLLGSLAGRCDDARPSLERMADQAEGDFQRGLRALVHMVRGLQAEVAREQGPTLRAA